MDDGCGVVECSFSSVPTAVAEDCWTEEPSKPSEVEFMSLQGISIFKKRNPSNFMSDENVLNL